MDQDATLYGGRPPPWRHFFRWGPSSKTERGTAAPSNLLGLFKGSPNSATDELFFIHREAEKKNQLVFVGNFFNKSPAVAEMGDRLTTIDTGRKVGSGCCVRCILARSSGSPSNTVWPGPRPTSLPSGVLIHPTV